MKINFKSPLFVGILAFIGGLIFGLVVLGWWLWPVEWQNAGPAQLNPEGQEEWLRMSIESYGMTGNAEQARDRYLALGENANTALTAIIQDPGTLSNELVLEYSTIVADITPTAPEKTPLSFLTWLLPILCLLLLVLIGVAAYFFLFKGRFKRTGTGQPTPAQEAAEARRQATYTDFAAIGEEAPAAQFMASYKFGDDLFDDSFSIDSASGEFLGECGVGISETIGVGDPKKVTAFEVWLFDKNDIQTVTRVLMSAHAFDDPTLRQRLEAKGELVLAQPGGETELDTQTLRMVARVVNMNYGEGAMPAQSYFDQFVLELSIWQK